MQTDDNIPPMKFKPFDLVWMMRNNRPTKCIVYSCTLSAKWKRLDWEYLIYCSESLVGAMPEKCVIGYDWSVFETKEQLISSL